MQIERLLKIIFILKNEGKTSAGELAKRLEVSRRTINRDVDTLSLSGIPIYTQIGKGGGISLLPEFVMDKSLITADEQNEILQSLSGLSTFTTDSTSQILEKLSTTFGTKTTSWISVDTSDWTGTGNQHWKVLKDAILSKSVIRFDYYNSSGELTNRKIEPSQLWFKSKNWYLRGFDTDKLSRRIFKLTRIRHLEILNETFNNYIDFEQDDEQEEMVDDLTPIMLRIDKSCAYRIFDDFEDHQVTKDEDDNYVITADFPIDNWAISYFLSFGANLVVVSPECLKQRINQEIKRMDDLY